MSSESLKAGTQISSPPGFIVAKNWNAGSAVTNASRLPFSARRMPGQDYHQPIRKAPCTWSGSFGYRHARVIGKILASVEHPKTKQLDRIHAKGRQSKAYRLLQGLVGLAKQADLGHRQASDKRWSFRIQSHQQVVLARYFELLEKPIHKDDASLSSRPRLGWVSCRAIATHDLFKNFLEGLTLLGLPHALSQEHETVDENVVKRFASTVQSSRILRGEQHEVFVRRLSASRTSSSHKNAFLELQSTICVLVIVDTHKFVPCTTSQVFDHACLATRRGTLDEDRKLACARSADEVLQVTLNERHAARVAAALGVHSLDPER
ncbi:hypothetical protein KC324_g69 [Hortaea werneckii]|nr:hypothetical protein KC324_g69 [Hortaea werneckii]